MAREGSRQNFKEAKRGKNDEFYTQFGDIQKELNAYLEYNPEAFKDKIVLLPCDDPEWSNFTRFFAQNFENFKLKKLIITSFGRFVTGKFPITGADGVPHYFGGLADDLKKKILESKLTVYECSGTESEIKEWFRTINIVGVPLNEQELSNAIHSGPFVTKAKEEFSNSQNANVQKWSAYIKGDVKRQEILRVALDWVSKGHIGAYMSMHRYDTDIKELKAYFTSVIDWVSSVFTDVESEMRGIPWGEYYEKYHTKSYNPQIVREEL